MLHGRVDVGVLDRKLLARRVEHLAIEFHIGHRQPDILVEIPLPGEQVGEIAVGWLELACAGGEHGKPAVDALGATAAVPHLLGPEHGMDATHRARQDRAEAVRHDTLDDLRFGQPHKRSV